MNSLSRIILCTSGFHTEGGGGGGAWYLPPPQPIPPPPPPPKNSPRCYCITYKQVYSRHSNRSNNIKIYRKYIKVQLDCSKIRQFFSLIFLPIALKLGVVYDIVGVSLKTLHALCTHRSLLYKILHRPLVLPPPPPPPAKNPV